MQNKIGRYWMWNTKEIWVLGLFILLKLAICAWPYEYGYFRDELYYIALSHHLDWGYIDVPPLLPFCIAFLRYTIGDSLFAIHLFSATTGVLILIIAWMMVKKMGGKLFSQVLALVCITLAPCYIGMESMCCYDCLNKLFWALALYFLVVLLVSANKKQWIYFGIAAGLGLMSKFDMLWLGAGIAIALVLTSQRKYFLTWQFWLGGIIVLLVVSPYLIWIATHEFLTVEYFINYSSQTQPITIFERIKEQAWALNPLTFPIWGMGLYYFLFNKTGKKFRLLGVAYIAVMFLCILLHTKFYLSLPYYVVLFAGGALFFESGIVKSSWLKITYISLIIVFGILSAPFVRPILPMPIFIKYSDFLGVTHGQTERNVTSIIVPQHFADRFGWEEMAAEFGRICNSLSDEERKNAVIVVGNYGEAGAIDFYRDKYNLPPVICGHLQYYLWKPKDLSEKTVVISLERDGVNGPKKVLNDVKQVGMTHCEYAIYYENDVPICLSKDFKIPPKKALQSLKSISM